MKQRNGCRLSMVLDRPPWYLHGPYYEFELYTIGRWVQGAIHSARRELNFDTQKNWRWGSIKQKSQWFCIYQQAFNIASYKTVFCFHEYVQFLLKKYHPFSRDILRAGILFCGFPNHANAIRALFSKSWCTSVELKCGNEKEITILIFFFLQTRFSEADCVATWLLSWVEICQTY